MTTADERPRMRLPSPLSEETERLVYNVIGAAIRVHKQLGPGLPERSYATAFAAELSAGGIPFEREVSVALQYRGATISSGKADFVIANAVVVELKCVSKLLPVHSSQLLKYLGAASLSVGLLFNFHEARLRDGIRRHLRTPKGQRQ